MGIEVSESNIVDDSIINKGVSIYTNLHIQFYALRPVHRFDIVRNVVFFYHVQSRQLLNGQQIVQVLHKMGVTLVRSFFR